jgi:hypothetical protein
VLVTVFSLGGMQVAFFGLNLPGPPSNYPPACSRREAQAAVVQSLVRQALQDGQEVVVCGDMNDYDGRYLDQNSHVPQSRVLRMLQDVDGDGVDELANIASLIDPSQRYTAWCVEYSRVRLLRLSKTDMPVLQE